ncbi:MAG TPA: hypothetical protein VN578_04685 [Candidatus Binatia bacterium]|jgi:hypothetical protein|nr:hypothetical protein [Candidatus Binatia bacterium]
MQPTRILPDLQCSLLCEEIRQEVTGNFFLIGVINFIRVPQLPVVALKLSLFNRWTAGVGQFTETVRLIAPDQTTVLRKGEVKFTLQDAALHATNVTLFGQVEFKVAGTYYVEVLVDDVMKLRYPVPVMVAPPPNQQAPPQAPPAPG